MEGIYSGRHVSPARGHSTEFTDYRAYMPGDEISDIDWKVFGRSDKLVVKLFEHHSDMTVNLVVDASASMAYAGVDGDQKPRTKKPSHAAISKYDHACRLAAAVAFLTTKQQDKVSLATVQQGLKSFDRPMSSFSHLGGLLKTLEDTQPTGEANLPEALRQLASQTNKRGVFIVISDLLDDFDDTLSALSALLHRGSEIILFHVLHADELHLPKLGQSVFIDSESNARVSLNIDDVRSEYQRRMKAFIAKWTHACRGRRMDYNLVSTATPSIESLEQYLISRGAMA